MSEPKYLIDTNVFIGLEDQAEVMPRFSSLLQLAGKHRVGVFIHAAAVDDIERDKDSERKRISLSKIRKFQVISKVLNLRRETLEQKFGPTPRPNDVVDATLLHSLEAGVADFLITEDRGLHERARRYAPTLTHRVLYVADAVSLLLTTYEPVNVPLPYVEEVDAHTIPLEDPIFESLREGYPEFDTWWREKCVRAMRKCWIVVNDDELAGLVVRKDEVKSDTDAKLPGSKILKICTFKVRPNQRGIKLGELLLKQILWFARSNHYDVVYLTTYPNQATLIDLLNYYGFSNTYAKNDGELVFEKSTANPVIKHNGDMSLFDLNRVNYPRFYMGSSVKTYVIPIKESFHEILFPELANQSQPDFFPLAPKTPGNTIRKVYLCRAPTRINDPGSILVFYKGKSERGPSQAITTIGIFEDMTLASSTEELRRLAGGRSVYSDIQLKDFNARPNNPVKVINFLLVQHIEPPIKLVDLKIKQIFSGHPPQSIASLSHEKMTAVLRSGSLNV